jgi:hypothetical protein
MTLAFWVGRHVGASTNNRMKLPAPLGDRAGNEGAVGRLARIPAPARRPIRVSCERQVWGGR